MNNKLLTWIIFGGVALYAIKQQQLRNKGLLGANDQGWRFSLNGDLVSNIITPIVTNNPIYAGIVREGVKSFINGLRVQ